MTTHAFEPPTRAASRQYWIDLLSQDDARARLGGRTGSAGSADAPPAPVDVRRSIGDELDGRLRAVTGGSPFLTLVAVSAAFALVAYRDSGIRRVVWATPTSRRDEEAPSTLVHDVHVDSAHSFRALLDRVRASMLEADRHRRYPFALVLDALRRSVPGHDLFDVVIAQAALHDGVPAVGQALTITLEPQPSEPQPSSVLLRATGPESDADSTARLLDRVVRALSAGLAMPDAPMATLDLLGAAERTRVITNWNPPSEAWNPVTVQEMIERHARACRDAVSATTLDGRRLTYGDLDARAVALAHRLVALGVRPDTVVGICLESTPDLLVAILAVWKAGAAYVPLDRSQPAARLRHALEDGGARIVVTCSAAAAADAESWGVQVVEVGAADPSDATVPLPAPDSRRLAYVLYTSGSSGRPRGVMVEHASLANYLRWAGAFYRPEEGGGVPVTSSSAFDLAVTSLLLPLTCGQFVIQDPALLTSDGLVTRLPAASGAALLKVTPGQVLALGDALPASDLRALTRCVVIGGEALRESHLCEWRAKAPSTRLVNEYGPTEATVGCAVHETRAIEAGATVPIGRPIANLRLYLLDADLEPVPDRVVGELYIAGAGLARGYRNLPRETAARFLPDPFASEPGTRMYRTSDLAVRRLDGNLEFVGRLDRQVKLRGYRIELGDVERALSGVPGVKAAAVSRVGDGHQAHLAAWIVPAGSAPPLRVVRQHVSQVLPDYMAPQSITVVNALPLTPNGKVDYAKLLGASNDAARVATPAVSARDVATSEAEAALLAIWREVLDAPDLGVHDNFLEVGGDSIVSIRVVGKARQAGWRIMPSQVFEHPTVAMLARVAEPLRDQVPARRDGADDNDVPLTPVQEWFFASAAAVDRCCQTRLVELTRPVDAERLEAGLQSIVNRHDALRLRFEKSDSGWTQRVAPEVTTPLVRTVSLAHLDAREREDARAAACAGCIDGLRVSGPTVQAVLMTSGSGTPDQLFLAIHHLAVDYLSWQVVLDELEATLEGRPPVGTPGMPFAAWARHLARRAADGAFDEDARAWHSAARRVGGVNEAWADAPAEPREVWRTLAVLDDDETAAVLRGMHTAYNTEVRDVLLTALATALIEDGDGAVRVALESNGRAAFADAADLTSSVGWFTAVAPVLLRLAGRDTAVRRLVSVKDLLRRLPADGIAFAASRRWSPDDSLRRALSEVPGPMVGFNYFGRADSETARRGLFRPLPGGYGELRPTDAFVPHRLDVTAVVVNGRLVTEFLWSDARDRGRAAAVTERYRVALRELIAACAQGDGPGATPGDFTLVSLDESTLAAVLDEVERGGDEVPS